MSFRRIQSRAVNHNVFLENRLTNFVSPHVHEGDLIIERNELVNGNLTVKQDINSHNFHATGNYYLNNYVLIPAGTIIQSAAIAVPDGWLDCNGQKLDIVVYSGLFDAISYAYGRDDDDFMVPDMRGRVGVGAGEGFDLSVRSLSEMGGAERHALTVEEMPTHSHTLTRRSNPDAGAYDISDAHQDESSAATTDRGDLGPFNTGDAGGGNTHNNMQPFLVIRYLIKY